MDLAGKVIDEGLPFSGSLRLALGSVTHRGWQECRKPILAIVTDELQAVAPCTLSWKGRLFRGPREVVAQSRRLAAQFLGPGQLAELLRVGSRGEPVEHAERWLRRQGFDPGAVDGVFDDAMDAAVRAFQQAEGLEVDGVIGTDTWRALRR